ncbi:MAG: efflux transporter outer membrane subunit [Proteobacteria bacterium]|nr:efflux transporter outer membrane subunit [Pseudomonadota bacterium]
MTDSRTRSARISAASPALAFLPCTPLRLVASGVCAALLLGGCTVGPNFQRPSAPQVDAYEHAQPQATVATPATAGGQAQHFITGRDIPGDWWSVFHSKSLDELIALSLRNNPDLAAARAVLRQAHEATLAQRGAYWPQVSAGLSATRQQDPPGALAPVPSNNAFLYSLYTPQLSVSYAPDVFGLNRRTVEALKAQEEATGYQLAAAHISLSTNVVSAAVHEAALIAQVDATDKTIAIDQQMVEILRYQMGKGYASRLDLATQEAQLAQAQAALPPLQTALEQQRHALAVLTGRLPSQAPDVDFDLDTLRLPQDLPLSLPSQLVRQRPDVLQAQANLHAANAQVGVAIANRFPSFDITASIGSDALKLGQLFDADTGFWSLAGSLTAPIFHGGTLLHQQRGAEAALDASAAQYRSTVLGAFQNVADTLSALDHDAQALQAAGKAMDAARTSLDLIRRQYKVGYANDLALLGAEQALQQARIGLVQAQASRYTDTAALYQALGGGWWHRDDLPIDPAQPERHPNEP